MDEQKNKILPNQLRPIIYVIFWALIAMVSSYTCAIECWNLDFINDSNFHGHILAPLLIWIIAFFTDYIYEIYTIDEKKEELSPSETRNTYIILWVIFVTLMLSMFHNSLIWERVLYIAVLIICISGLKYNALKVIRPICEVTKR